MYNKHSLARGGSATVRRGEQLVLVWPRMMDRRQPCRTRLDAPLSLEHTAGKLAPCSVLLPTTNIFIPFHPWLGTARTDAARTLDSAATREDKPAVASSPLPRTRHAEIGPLMPSDTDTMASSRPSSCWRFSPYHIDAAKYRHWPLPQQSASPSSR